MWQVVLEYFKSKNKLFCLDLSRNSDTDTKIYSIAPRKKQILSIQNLVDEAYAVLSNNQKSKQILKSYDSEIFQQCLENYGSVAILSLDFGDLSKVTSEYGDDVFDRYSLYIDSLVEKLWSLKGGLRATDLIMRQTKDSNNYYVLLSSVRKANQNWPKPGSLESLADRVTLVLHQSLGEDSRDRTCVLNKIKHEDLPQFKIGYADIVQNPTFELKVSLQMLFDRAEISANIQNERFLTRHREFINCLCIETDLLVPHYQAVVNLEGVEESTLRGMEPNTFIQSNFGDVYSFEALIRLNKQRASEYFSEVSNNLIGLEGFNPFVLFQMAKKLHLALELDQACAIKALEKSQDFTHPIMVNILPRNICNVFKFRTLIQSNRKFTLEISETEAIKNYQMLRFYQQQLKELGINIAADDFGQGFANLARIKQLNPDVLKLDRDLIKDIDTEPLKVQYLTPIIKECAAKGILVLAEGVERVAEALKLRTMGINLQQGYWFHKPESAEKIMVIDAAYSSDQESQNTQVEVVKSA